MDTGTVQDDVKFCTKKRTH